MESTVFVDSIPMEDGWQLDINVSGQENFVIRVPEDTAALIATGILIELETIGYIKNEFVKSYLGQAGN